MKEHERGTAMAGFLTPHIRVDPHMARQIHVHRRMEPREVALPWRATLVAVADRGRTPHPV